MTLYEELSADIAAAAEAEYARFHSKLLHNENIKVMGVRVPVLRKLAKKYLPRIDELLFLPDDCYEITFIKLSAASLLDYEKFISVLDKCVSLIDNWATCDCFVPKCIEKHRDDFLPYVFRYAQSDGEFTQRFALTTLLHFYVKKEYLPIICDCILKVDCSRYYVHMAAAWLVAEIIIKYYDDGVAFLKNNLLDKKTHNKAIQKARESYRLSHGQKEEITALKIRN